MNANKAWEITQKVNRDRWFNNSIGQINAAVEAAASVGKSETSLSIDPLIVGAENLKEANELLQMIDRWLIKNEYITCITPLGRLQISWEQ